MSNNTHNRKIAQFLEKAAGIAGDMERELSREENDDVSQFLREKRQELRETISRVVGGREGYFLHDDALFKLIKMSTIADDDRIPIQDFCATYVDPYRAYLAELAHDYATRPSDAEYSMEVDPQLAELFGGNEPIETLDNYLPPANTRKSGAPENRPAHRHQHRRVRRSDGSAA